MGTYYVIRMLYNKSSFKVQMFPLFTLHLVSLYILDKNHIFLLNLMFIIVPFISMGNICKSTALNSRLLLNQQ